MAIETRCPASTATGETLFMALELGSTTWKVAFASLMAWAHVHRSVG
jgi:hypothetical protein